MKAAALQIRAMSRCAIAPPLGWLKSDLMLPPWPGAYVSVAPLNSEANQISGSLRGANEGRCRATQGDVWRRLVQLTGSSGDAGRCSATVRLRLTSDGERVEPSCAHQVRSLFRHAALVAKSKRRAKGLTAGGRGRAAVHAQPSDHPSVPGAGHPARRSPGPGRPERGGPGQGPGRPSKGLTLEQAQDLLRAAGGSRLYAYVVLSVTTGLRTEELRLFI